MDRRVVARANSRAQEAAIFPGRSVRASRGIRLVNFFSLDPRIGRPAAFGDTSFLGRSDDRPIDINASRHAKNASTRLYFFFSGQLHPSFYLFLLLSLPSAQPACLRCSVQDSRATSSIDGSLEIYRPVPKTRYCSISYRPPLRLRTVSRARASNVDSRPNQRRAVIRIYARTRFRRRDPWTEIDDDRRFLGIGCRLECRRVERSRGERRKRRERNRFRGVARSARNRADSPAPTGLINISNTGGGRN